MMPSKKRKYNARFPAGRIKKIMQTDEDVGKVAQAVPVIISRALELFVESLLTKTVLITNAKNAKTMTPQHMKQCILSESRFDFLKELVINVSDVSTADDEPTTPLTSGPPLPFPVSLKKYEGAGSRGRGRGSGTRHSSNRSSPSSHSAPPIVSNTSVFFKDPVRPTDEAESLANKELTNRPPVIQHTGAANHRPLPDDSSDEELSEEEEAVEEDKNGYVEVSNHSKPLVIDEDYDT